MTGVSTSCTVLRTRSSAGFPRARSGAFFGATTVAAFAFGAAARFVTFTPVAFGAGFDTRAVGRETGVRVTARRVAAFFEAAFLVGFRATVFLAVAFFGAGLAGVRALAVAFCAGRAAFLAAVPVTLAVARRVRAALVLALVARLFATTVRRVFPRFVAADAAFRLAMADSFQSLTVCR